MQMITFITVLMGGLTPNEDGKWWLFYGVNNKNNNEMKEIIFWDRVWN